VRSSSSSARDDLDSSLLADPRVRRIERPAGGVSIARNRDLARRRTGLRRRGYSHCDPQHLGFRSGGNPALRRPNSTCRRQRNGGGLEWPGSWERRPRSTHVAGLSGSSGFRVGRVERIRVEFKTAEVKVDGVVESLPIPVTAGQTAPGAGLSRRSAATPHEPGGAGDPRPRGRLTAESEARQDLPAGASGRRHASNSSPNRPSVKRRLAHVRAAAPSLAAACGFSISHLRISVSCSTSPGS